MKNHINSQKGVSQIVIILVVVGTLVFGGAYFYVIDFIQKNDAYMPTISPQVFQKKERPTTNQFLAEKLSYKTIESIPEIMIESSLEFEQKCKILNGAMYDAFNSATYCYIPFDEKYKNFRALELFNSAFLIRERGYIGPGYIGSKDYTENDEIINNNGFVITLLYFEERGDNLVEKYIVQKGLAVPFATLDKKALVIKGFNGNSSLAGAIQLEINKIICKEMFIKPLDISKVITDPETKMEIINNQLLITFYENVSPGDIFKKLRALNGEIVGCVFQKDYQVEFPGISFEELRRLKDLLNKDSQIEAVSWNSIADPL